MQPSSVNFIQRKEVLAFDNPKLEVFQEIQAESLPTLSLPHPGYLSTKYSNVHPGIDIATGFGMPIHPITEGVVLDIQFGFLGLGNYVTISHADALKSTYGHMGRVFVKTNQEVDQSTTLGTVGMSGFTTGPHTHLEIEKEGKRIDPATILPKMDDYPKEEHLKAFGGTTKEGSKLSKSLKPEL